MGNGSAIVLYIIPVSNCRRYIMFTLWSDIDRLFNRSLADWMQDERAFREDCLYGAYRMNLIDKGDNLEFIAELPGVEEKDMNLSVHNDTLTLSAKRAVKYDEGDTLYLSERGNYDVKRSIALPVRVDADKSTASLKNGVLRVVLPKSPESQPKQIAISC
jgi:HSP20 family protein